ncbi:HCL204Cp [Eremothecium sinecaudum]|uniref:HCL204Cp n=1 Tax=Eremothecium sinecaudum TaxID=45286 RepID=A0A0X8HR73_9SACH|nr:HCL204Cp [Eremothecium sinecaudum]AMD19947.1 HCL204Cp [Eremothecium sinecaudum]
MAEVNSTKRFKPDVQQPNDSKLVSKVFSPFRIIGNVSNEIPFAIGTLGSTFYIATSIGKSFQIYDASNLHLLFVCERETEFKITCLAAHYHHLYAGYGNKVGIYKRGKQVAVVELPDASCTVKHLCVFGDYLCVSADNNSVYVFRKETPASKVPCQFYTSFTINASKSNQIVSVIHLATYLNKIIVVSKSNFMLYNIRTRKLLYTSDEFPSQITTATPAPALDVMALGLNTGEVILFNVKKARKLRTIKTPFVVSSLSFRTDGSAHVAVGATNGSIMFYDMDRRSRIHIMNGVHKESEGGVVRASFLNGQPIVVTTGGDNQLKEFAFDPSLSQADSEIVVQPPRLLRSRGGHSQPPTCITFADNESHFVLSASKDKSLRGFSLRKDAQSYELSQRLHKNKDGSRIAGSTVKEKFSEIVSIAIGNFREGEWENIITGHKDERFARTWNSRTKRVGRWTLPTSDDGLVKAVAISHCGNFGFVGSSNGGIAVYNLQSGIKRKVYKLHKKAVTGVAIDGFNRRLVSCGLDGIVGFYDFNSNTLLGKLQLDAPITQMVYHKSSDIAVFALDDFSIFVIDTITMRIIRQLWGHSNRITALDFSPDGRWVVSASLDSTIRTWDLPTGGCIDGIKLENVATGLKFSPKGDFLATTHVFGNGISLWTNRAQFKAISTRHIDEEEFASTLLPSSAQQGGASLLDGAFDQEEGEYFANKYTSLDQISDDLITLSLGPRSKMNTLIKLDVIKQRSKPKEAPKKPEKLPFFLQLTGEKVGDEASSREGVEAQDVASQLNMKEAGRKAVEAEENLAKFKPSGEVSFESKFTKLLRVCSQSEDYSEFLDTLVSMAPSAIDLEIRSLNAFEPFEEIIAFINALAFGLTTNKNFDIYEAFMNMFLRVHGSIINANHNNKAIQKAINAWEKNHAANVQKLDDLVKMCSSIIGFVSTV